MGYYNLDDIRERTISKMNAKRFEHCEGVAYTAAALAMVYDSSDEFVEKALVAGILHDNAKCFSDEVLLSQSIEAGIAVNEVERNTPFLLHGKLGAILTKTEYNIQDEDICNAIYWHTTGRPEMSLLEKIVFVADYIEPGRYKQKNLPMLRHLAFVDIDKCIYQIAEDTLDYLGNKSNNIDPMTVKTRDYYKELVNGR